MSPCLQRNIVIFIIFVVFIDGYLKYCKFIEMNFVGVRCMIISQNTVKITKKLSSLLMQQ